MRVTFIESKYLKTRKQKERKLYAYYNYSSTNIKRWKTFQNLLNGLKHMLYLTDLFFVEKSVQ